MATNLFWAISFIALSLSIGIGAQPIKNIPPKSVSVKIQHPYIVINTAVSDSIRKEPFRYGPSANWVRGQQEPLYVIDGRLEEADKLQQLNPQDIESIEVLKGYRAAALYGTRGINGVWVITT